MILQRQSGLGRGLGAIIPQRQDPSTGNPPTGHGGVRHTEEAGDMNRAPSPGPREPESGQRVIEVPISTIERNPHQPRVHFDHADLEDLISSIREHGVLQPIIVTPKPDGSYQLIAGERRLRASTIAGLKTIPALVREATELQKLELAIIENVQRANLNPIEEARAYLRLADEFGMTQDDIGRKIGKSRPQVANIIRLLQLPDEIQQALVDGRISASNARTLLSLPTEKERTDLFQAMLAGNFTVRQTETRVSISKKPLGKDANIADAEARMREALHTKVAVTRSLRGSGDIKIHFDSDEELAKLVERLTNHTP